MSLDIEGHAFLESLNRLNLEERKIPSFTDVALAIAAAGFVAKYGNDNPNLTLPEMVLVDLATTFLKLTKTPMDDELWKSLMELKAFFEGNDPDGCDSA